MRTLKIVCCKIVQDINGGTKKIYVFFELLEAGGCEVYISYKSGSL